MEIMNRTSAFQNHRNFPGVIAERPKRASEKNSEPIKSEQIKLSNGLGYGVIMIMSNEQSE